MKRFSIRAKPVPAYPEARLELGYVHPRMERYEEAAEHFSKTAELDPEYVRAHCNLAWQCCI